MIFHTLLASVLPAPDSPLMMIESIKEVSQRGGERNIKWRDKKDIALVLFVAVHCSVGVIGQSITIYTFNITHKHHRYYQT